VTVHQFGLIYYTEIITIVRYIYAHYNVWGGGSGALVDDFFNREVGSPIGMGNFFWRGRNQTAQWNV